MNPLGKSIYFPGLNGLRFIAALLVIISHVEELKLYNHYENIRENPTIYHMGSLAVTFFFVLSGFLITYLLMEEKSQQGSISLKDFYLKRIVRIWPLYYLIVVLGLFIVPKFHALDLPAFHGELKDHFLLKSLLLFSILPNVAFANRLGVSYTVHTWSIGVEEQFYIIWPLVILYTRHYLKGILGTIAIYIGIVMGLRLGLRLATDSAFLEVATTFIKLTRIDCMAIGGIGAWLVFRKQQDRLAMLYHPVTEALAWMITFVLIAKPAQFPAFTQEIYSLFFLVIILNVATNPRTKVNLILENRVFNYLGKISYGLYMYHFVIIGIALAIVRNSGFAGHLGLAGNSELYGLVLGLTVAVAALSYRYFENPIIRLRPRLSQLLSRQRLMELFGSNQAVH